jgi:hypothetical protein
VMDVDSVPATDPVMVAAVLGGVNTYFQPIGASFELCEVRYIYNFQYKDTLSDEYRSEMTNQNFADGRINIYYFSSFKNPGVGGKCYGSVAVGEGSIGIASHTVSVVAHELGHYFSLIHTFGSSTAPGATKSTELVDGSNCTTTGDMVCDTPADPYIDGNSPDLYINRNDNCNYINYERDANNQYYVPDVGNIMSYYQCNNCLHFTTGQLRRMAEFYLSIPNAKRSW